MQRTPEGEARRGLARLRRAIEKARREVRGLRAALAQAEADGFPGDDYAEMDRHLAAAAELVLREASRQQAKVLRAGGIAPSGVRSRGGPAPLATEGGVGDEEQ
ncbi:MAG: hypothetical protein J4F34_02985 [Gemmatimonadetes bacterium]|nr:hypothetical protein [Gemmatimonadota bacterium]